LKKGKSRELKIKRFKERGWGGKAKRTNKIPEKNPGFRGAVIKIKPTYILAAVTIIIVGLSLGLFFYGSALISGVKQTNDQLSQELSDARSQLKTRNGEIKRLERELKSAEEEDEKQIDELNGRINELSAQVEELRQQLDLNDSTKKVYLTFDDGPSENTPKILDILEAQDVKATFFVVNTMHNKYMKKIVNSGNTIALHSYSHDYSHIYSSEKAFWEDFDSIRALVKEQTGVETNVFRFPGGTANQSSAAYSKGIMTKLAATANKKGYAYFDWNALNGDADGGTHTYAQMIEMATEPIGRELDRVVLLMHDSAPKTDTPKVLPAIIEAYKQNGYVFETLSEDTPPLRQEVKN